MLGNLTLANPLAWVHFRLRGGWKNIITTVTAFAVIISGLILASLQANPLAAADTLYFWTNALLGLQIGALVLFACSSIRTAVRKDITTHMIESHRLMPVPASQAVVGYLFGPTVQSLCIAGVILILGTLTSAASGLKLHDWLLANFILFVFALFAWFLSVLLSLLTPAAMGLLIGALTVCTISGGTALAVLPGLTILTGPVIENSIFGIVQRGGTWSWGHQISTLAQMTAAGFCFLGATRKYRREDMLAFDPGFALLLVAGWVTLSVMGIRHFDDFQTRFWGRMPMEAEVQTIASLLTGTLVALIPITGSAFQQADWSRRRLLADPALGRRPVPVAVITTFAIALLLLLPVGVAGNRIHADRLLPTAVTIGAFLFSTAYVFRIALRGGSGRTNGAVALWIFLSWLAPLLLDLLRFILGGVEEEPVITGISTASPIGALIQAWRPERQPVVGGLVVQLAIMLTLAGLYHRAVARARRQPSP